jgi:mannose-1-phosphate guanylyltransferase/phosphomannomutase
MLKRSMMAGLNAAGVNVLDLEVASVPLTRFAVRRPDVVGGITLRLSTADPQSCSIRFFDTEGADLTEDGQRKIERLFVREDFRRVFPTEIGDIGFPPRAIELYTAALEATVDIEAIRAARFKVVVDYSFGSTSFVMPNVLAKLGADVLAVNPYASTGRALAFDAEAHAQEVAALVKASGAHLGAVVDPDGEHLRLIDDTGRILADDQSLLAMLQLVSSHLLGDTVAVPVNVTRHAEALAEANGAKVRRTKLATSALMDAAGEPGVGFAASNDGGFILPGFLPAFDAAASLVKLLELLARSEVRLSEVVDDLPRVRIARETVVTPWEQKGMVMRTLVEMSKDREVELIDGVRVHHDGGWALALPDPEEPVTHVWAEAATDAEAKALAKEYARRIRQLLR